MLFKCHHSCKGAGHREVALASQVLYNSCDSLSKHSLCLLNGINLSMEF